MSDILSEAQESLRREEEEMAGAGADRASSGADFENMTENNAARFSLPDMSFLLSPTGEGSIESYIDHPFNAQRSRGMAQMLRGFTGIAGNLDYAIVDIAIGAINYSKEGKGHEAANRE